jgi:hypothetical protein
MAVSSSAASNMMARAAMIYQHEAQGADTAFTDAIDTHVQGRADKAQRRGRACRSRLANGPDGI